MNNKQSVLLSVKDYIKFEDIIKRKKKLEKIDVENPRSLNPKSTFSILGEVIDEYHNFKKYLFLKYFQFDPITKNYDYQYNIENKNLELFIKSIEYRSPQDHIKIIKNYQNLLGDFIQVENHGAVVTTLGLDKTTPDYKSKIIGKKLHLQIAYMCNTYCKFCPQFQRNMNHEYDCFNTIFTDINQYKILFDSNENNYKCIEYMGGEPLISNYDLLLELADYINNKSNGNVHQVVMTNGIALTENIVKQLKNVGIKEIKVNLAAADFRKDVIEKLSYINKYMEYNTVELPAIPETCIAFVENGLLKQLPITHLNLTSLRFMNNDKHIWNNYASIGPIVKFEYKSDYYAAYTHDNIYKILLYAKKNNINWINITDINYLTHLFENVNKQ